MKTLPLKHYQQGTVLIVGMIMLVLITLMVSAAFTLSNSNVQAVGNMQSLNEATDAANQAIEITVGSWAMTSTFPANQVDVDINNDGTADYNVQIAQPVCRRAVLVAVPSNTGSGTYIDQSGNVVGNTGTSTASKMYNFVADITATVTSKSNGSQVVVHQGLSKVVPQAQCNNVCNTGPAPVQCT